MRTRDSKIDYLKCFAIYLVILGHLIQSITTGFSDNIIYNVIYSFHMPLFVFLSGLTACKSRDDINYYFILKKFKSLVIPFLMWAFVSSILIYKLNLMMNLNHILDILKTPDKGLWFLWSLFFINIFYYFSVKISEGVTPLLLSYIFFLAIIFFFNLDNIFAFKQTVWLIPFFVLGYWTSNNKEKILEVFQKRFSTVMMLILYSTVFYLMYHVFEGFLINFFLKNVLAIIGCLFFYALFDTFELKSDFVQKIGRLTIGIYAIHFYVLNFLLVHVFCRNEFLFIFMSVIVLISSYYISVLIKRLRILSFLFLGQ